MPYAIGSNPLGKTVSGIGFPLLSTAFSEYLAPVQVAVDQEIALDRSVSVRIAPPRNALGQIVSDRFAPCSDYSGFRGGFSGSKAVRAPFGSSLGS